MGTSSHAWRMVSLGLLVVVGCRRVPAALRPTVDRHLSQVQALAATAGARCEEVRNGGLVARIQGTVPASPAVGTALERDPEALQAEVTCYWPSPGGGGGGNSFVALRADAERRGGREDVYPISGKDDNRHTFEEVINPAVEVNDPAAFDLRVVRPTPSGGWVDVVVTLKPGNTVMRPPPTPMVPVRLQR